MFASREPPRFNLCLTVFPDDAGIDGKPVLRQQRAAAVGHFTASQLHIVAADHAPALFRHVFWRQIHFWHHQGLAVNGRRLPPQDAVVERCNLVSRQGHTKLQTQRFLLCGGAVHQVTGVALGQGDGIHQSGE